MDYIDLRQTVQESNPTCCLKVNLSLLGAAGEGDYRALRGLLQCPGSKSNINTVNIKGQSPLYIASMMGHFQAVNVLLQDINVDANIGRNMNGGTAFSIASEKSRFNVMKMHVVSGKSDQNKGWCSDQWANPCHASNDELTKTPTIIPSSGRV